MKISIFNSLISDVIIIVSNYCVLCILNGEVNQLTSFLRESWIQVANKILPVDEIFWNQIV